MLPQQKLNQTPNGGINYIHSLPVEILYMVFDCLDLDDVKNASLVCKRWCNIIFSSAYISRFVLKIDVRKCDPKLQGSWQRMEELVLSKELQLDVQAITKRVIDIALHSERRYRNLNCVIVPLGDPEIPLLWESLYTQWSSRLQSLELSIFDAKSVAELLPSIASAIQMMPDLHSLTLRKWKDEPFIYFYSPTILQSSTVKQVTIDSVCNIRIDMPQLQTFIGPFSAICHSANIAQPDALGNLKHLTLTIEEDYCDWKNITQTELSIIRRLTHLETFEYMCFHNNKIFIAICETCNKLKTLRLAIPPYTPSILDHLTKLNHLHQLEVKVCFGVSEIPQLNLSPLTKLEKLTVQCRYLNSLILPKSVKILNIGINDFHINVIQTILKYNMQLTELTLKMADLNSYELNEILQILPVLKNLEVLEFSGGTFGKSDFLCINTPVDRLRRLKFNNCHLETKEFLGLKEKFPNLKILDFSYSTRMLERHPSFKSETIVFA